MCLNGLFIGLELKDRNGVVSSIQELNLIKIEKKGKGISLVADQDNWDIVKQILTAIDKGENYDSIKKKADWKSFVSNRTTKANAS